MAETEPLWVVRYRIANKRGDWYPDPHTTTRRAATAEAATAAVLDGWPHAAEVIAVEPAPLFHGYTRGHTYRIELTRPHAGIDPAIDGDALIARFDLNSYRRHSIEPGRLAIAESVTAFLNANTPS